MADESDFAQNSMGPDASHATGPNLSETNYDNPNMGIDNTNIGASVLTDRRNAFRRNALVLVTYPWASGILMQDDLSQVFAKDHYTFVRLFLFFVYGT